MSEPSLDSQPGSEHDPRESLASWANGQDEWVRSIARRVLQTGRELSKDDLDDVYALLRQEKGLDERRLLKEVELQADAACEEAELPLRVTSLADVTGVNALMTGSAIEPHEGMTILFGENGAGKTGYSRIFKALAGSRTADTILSDIAIGGDVPISAKIGYTMGEESKEFLWKGENGVAPFTRMSIFDSPGVHFHVDDDLEYSYVPAVLAIFNHVNLAIKGVQDRIEWSISRFSSDTSTLLGRFPRESTVYPGIETLGASTDLAFLESKLDRGEDLEARTEVLRRAVGALETNAITTQVRNAQRLQRALVQAHAAAQALRSFDVEALNVSIDKLESLSSDYESFRTALFAAADLPAVPEETWYSFVVAGEKYAAHLEALSLHDSNRCLYCRQPLDASAINLVAKYGDYLTDKISVDIEAEKASIVTSTKLIRDLQLGDVGSLATEYKDQEERPESYDSIIKLQSAIAEILDATAGLRHVDISLLEGTAAASTVVSAHLTTVNASILDLQTQSMNRVDALREKNAELAELLAAGELAKSWHTIQIYVIGASEVSLLQNVVGRFRSLTRAITALSKTASDQLINQNFDKLFDEECKALRAPGLDVEFVGRQGVAKRRRTLGGDKLKPSKVLSEGEQKVIALSDFLAETRLSGSAAPIIFDDPVSSLDHRRIGEVAQRVANLASNRQVIVFTHDILFAATLLSLFEVSKRCTYFQITDEDGKGRITRASGPRWDSLSNLTKNINRTIQSAQTSDGDARAALVREGYDWIRSWCEVFTEMELLNGVSKRYQPNISMTPLRSLKSEALPAAIEVVVRVFDDACRFIPGHSQPLVTLNVSPTLSALNAHWEELKAAQSAFRNADS